MIKDIREINFPEYATLSQATVNIADMGERSITTNIKIDGNIVPDFSFDWEIEYKGERYIHTAREPQASKENTSIRTSIDLTFKHWAIVELQRYYFMEMASTEAGTAIADKYKASLGLSLPDFVNAFNTVLDYYFDGNIQIVLNPAWVASSEASFVEINYSYLWDVLQKVYEIYGVRWTLEPVTGETRKYLIKFGYDAPEASHTFEYGYKGGLLKVAQQVQSSDIKNILLGRGGNKNLPYLYFKDYDKYGAGTSSDTSGSSETKTIAGVTAPAVSSLPKYGKAIVKAKYTGTFEIPEGKSGVLMASVPTATGYYTSNNAPAYIPENGKFIWDKNEEVEVVFISLGSPNIQVYDKETDEQVSQVAIPSGKYYYTWENEVTNNYTDTLHDVVVTLPNLTLITGSGSVIGASLTGNRGFRPDPDAIPELKDIAFTELRSIEFREYVQGWKAAHYGGEIPAEQSEAFIKGLTDEKFNPVEYVKDDDSIAKYGEQWGALDNNEEIYPSIQGSGIDDVIDVEQIQTDAVDNSDLFAFTEEIDIPQRATGLVIEPYSTVEYSFYVNGSEKFQYDDYKNSISLSSYELEAKDLSNQQYVGADSFDVIAKEIKMLTTAFDWGKISVRLNITNNSDKRVSIVKFLGQLKVYYRLNGTTDNVGNALYNTAFTDYAPTKTGSQSKLTRTASLYCYGSNTKRAIIHIPYGYVGIVPDCKLGDTAIKRYDNVSTEDLVYEVKLKNAVFIDITNENNTYDFNAENGIPAGDYYFKCTYEYSVTNVPNNKSWMLSQGITLSLTLKAEHPELLKSPYTFDIWVKNLWGTEKRADETDKQYAERVWFPIIGQNDAELTFTSGLLAISSDYQFKIAYTPVYDTSKVYNGEQSHWRITLNKSDAEYEATGLYIPNTRINAKAGDKFFFTNIELPHQYVLWAEKKLHDYKVDNLDQVSDIKPTWAVSLDKVRCNNIEAGDVKKLIDQIQVGSAVRISHPFITDAPYNTLYIQSATYTYNEPTEDNPNIYPDVEIVLSDKVVAVTNTVSLMQGEIDALRQLVGGSLSNIEQVVRAIGDRIYLRKDGVNDVDAGYARFQRGAQFDKQTDFKDDVIIGKDGYAEGLTGFGIRLGRDGGGEMESLILRRFLEVPELRYNRVDITLGNAWRAVCAGIIENVIPDTDTNGNQLDSGIIYLKLENGEAGSVAVDDICMGIFHNETDLTDNAITDSDDSKGNFTFAGFSTVYFRVTEILEESNNSTFRYVLRAADDTWTQKYHPQVGMTFSGYGNFTNKNRQTSKYETRTYERYLKDVDTWTFSARNVAAQFGDLSNLGTLLGVDMTGYSIYLNNIYMTGRIQQLNSQGEEVPVITDRGVWSSSETYYKNDDVYHNNAKWRCLVDGTTSEPSKDNSAWQLLEEALNGSSYTENLLLNSKARRTAINETAGDHYKYYYDMTISLVKGETYTISAKTNGYFTDAHDPSATDNRIVLWVGNKQQEYPQIVSGTDMASDGSKGHTFVWNRDYTDCVIRINTYGIGEWWVEEIKIEKGTNPHPVWTPNSTEMIGKDGVNGCILRTSQWASGAEYHNDTDSKEDGVKYLDVVVINDANGNQYRFQCAQTHTSDESNKPPTNLVGNAYWSPLSNMAPLYTPLLLADNAEIAFVNGTRILIKNTDGNVCAGMMADDTLKDTPFWLGADYDNRNNAPFRMNSKGQGVANDLTLNGSYKSSTGYWDGTNGNDVFLGDSNGLGRKDNIVIPIGNTDELTEIPYSSFAWGTENVGRIIRLINYKWGGDFAIGKTIIKAPSNKFFYENGKAYSQIIISREMIELVGYGIPAGAINEDGAIMMPQFYGWIVSRRVDLGSQYVYGSANKIVAAGTIMRDSSGLHVHNLWTYRLFNKTSENWSIQDENPNVKVILPNNLVSGKKYTVTLQATLIPPEPNISNVSIDIGSCALSAILVEQTSTSFTYRPIRGNTHVPQHCVYFEIHSTAEFTTPTAISSASVNNEPMAVSMAIGQEIVNQETEPVIYVLKHEKGIG